MAPVDQTGAEVFRPQTIPYYFYFFGNRADAFTFLIFSAK